MFYLVKTPWILKKLYASCTWQMPGNEKILYLTFDDGPHPEATPFVLDTLKKYNALATFFCIGKNVAAYPDIYRRILNDGHKTGNHTHNHLNGWKTDDKLYFENLVEAKKYIDSNLFRPPYGKASALQIKYIREAFKMEIVMWTVLSADFNPQLSQEKCLQNVIASSKSGNIIVFHDSEKAMQKLTYALPRVLDHFSAKGYRFDKINL